MPSFVWHSCRLPDQTWFVFPQRLQSFVGRTRGLEFTRWSRPRWILTVLGIVLKTSYTRPSIQYAILPDTHRWSVCSHPVGLVTSWNFELTSTEYNWRGTSAAGSACSWLNYWFVCIYTSLSMVVYGFICFKIRISIANWSTDTSAWSSDVCRLLSHWEPLKQTSWPSQALSDPFFLLTLFSTLELYLVVPISDTYTPSSQCPLLKPLFPPSQLLPLLPPNHYCLPQLKPPSPLRRLVASFP